MQGKEREHFKSWSSHFTKSYQEGTEEFEQRLTHWSDNVHHLIGQQSGDAEHVEVNGLMDMQDDEFREAYLGHLRRTPHFG